MSSLVGSPGLVLIVTRATPPAWGDSRDCHQRFGHLLWVMATHGKALVTPLRDRFSIELADGTELKAKGNIVDHEYKIERDGDTVAQVSKRWLRVRETYGIEIAPGQDDALILAITACIDEMEGR